jgi:hypothetical protein
MSDLNALRNEAKQAAIKAIQYDENGDLKDAMEHYIKAAQKLQACFKIDENPNTKDVYKKKAIEYATRAQEIKGTIGTTNGNTTNTDNTNTSNGTKPSTSNGNTGNTQTNTNG